MGLSNTRRIKCAPPVQDRGRTWPLPNYDRRKSPWDMTLGCRTREREAVPPVQRAGESLHPVVDSTDLEGIWRRRVEGTQARLFKAAHLRKVHLASWRWR